MNACEQKEFKQPRHSGLFQPGQSGNPTGRPKADMTIRDLAKTYTEEAIDTLAEIMRNPKASAATRVQASCALLDRGWGKPAQHVESVTVGMSYAEFLEESLKQEAEYQTKLDNIIDITPLPSEDSLPVQAELDDFLMGV